MQGYSNQFTRVTIESSRYEGKQLLVTGTAMAGERFEDFVWYDAAGFHSRPRKGSLGYMMAPGGRRGQGMVMAAADPSTLPELEEGEAAMYDAGGNVVKLTASGWEFNADVTINGNLNLSGNIVAGGTIVDSDGNNGA